MTRSLALACSITLALCGLAAANPPPRSMEFRKQPKQTWTQRGVYFFDGPYKSQLAGLGKRGDYASNYLALVQLVCSRLWLVS